MFRSVFRVPIFRLFDRVVIIETPPAQLVADVVTKDLFDVSSSFQIWVGFCRFHVHVGRSDPSRYRHKG